CRGGLHGPEGGRLAGARRVRVRRDDDLHGDPADRLCVCMAKRGARMALTSGEIAGRILAAVPASDARAVEGALMPTIEVGATEMPDVLAFLRDAPGLECKLFVDATAVDFETPRGVIEIVYIVRSAADFSIQIVLKTVVDVAEAVMPT